MLGPCFHYGCVLFSDGNAIQGMCACQDWDNRPNVGPTNRRLVGNPEQGNDCTHKAPFLAIPFGAMLQKSNIACSCAICLLLTCAFGKARISNCGAWLPTLRYAKGNIGIGQKGALDHDTPNHRYRIKDTGFRPLCRRELELQRVSGKASLLVRLRPDCALLCF